jgi:hypothetical protein
MIEEDGLTLRWRDRSDLESFAEDFVLAMFYFVFLIP